MHVKICGLQRAGSMRHSLNSLNGLERIQSTGLVARRLSADMPADGIEPRYPPVWVRCARGSLDQQRSAQLSELIGGEYQFGTEFGIRRVAGGPDCVELCKSKSGGPAMPETAPTRLSSSGVGHHIELLGVNRLGLQTTERPVRDQPPRSSSLASAISPSQKPGKRPQ
jgi:hypothetical protein